MSKLLTDLQNNLSFVLVCVLIVVALSLLTHGAERFMKTKRNASPARRVTLIGIFAAIAAVLHIFDFPLTFLAPDFYKLDFSELPVLICGFYLGPSSAVACEGVKILLKLLIKSTSTAFVGDLANFITGCALVLPAIFIYHIKKTKALALVGLIAGTIFLSLFGSAFNAIYLLPKFSQLFGMPMEVIIGAGAAIHPGIRNVSTFVLMCVVPLNLVKGISVSVLTLLLYKRIEKILFLKK